MVVNTYDEVGYVEATLTKTALTKGECMKIEWSEEFEANTEIQYNHINADTPVGDFSIQWKGWKEWDSKCVYLNNEYLNSFCEIDEAKEFVNEYLIGLYNKLGEMYE